MNRSVAGRGQPLPRGQVAERAHRACEKCTRTKKKCDKLMPSCSRCTRLSMPCCYDYVFTGPSTTAVEPAALVQQLLAGGGGGPATSAEASRNFSIFEPKLDITAPMILALLSSKKQDWREAATLYFNSVNPFLNVVHRQSFETKGISLHSKDNPERPTLALLIVAMALTTEMPNSGGHLLMFEDSTFQPPSYIVTKRLLNLLQDNSGPSIELLQSAVLLALFEFGHGLSMQAYATMGKVATMVNLLQLRPAKYKESQRSQPLSPEEEESCALYWSAFALDRIIHVEERIMWMPMLVQSPPMDAILSAIPLSPADAKDQQVSSPQIHRYPLTVPPSTPLGAFNHLCQSAMLLETALDWQRGLGHKHERPTVDSFVALETSSRALISAMSSRDLQRDQTEACFAVCACLLVQLYSRVLDGIDAEAVEKAPTDANLLKGIVGINSVIRLIVDNTASLNEKYSQNADQLVCCSPMSAYSAFHCLRALMSFDHMIPEAEMRFHNTYYTLHFFAKRWGVTGQLLGHIETAMGEKDGAQKNKQPTNILSTDIFR